MARSLFSQLNGANNHIRCLHMFPLSTKSPLVTPADSGKFYANGQADTFTARWDTITVMMLLHAASPTEPGSAFRVCFTVYSPDGSLSNRKISSGEHVRVFAIGNVLPSQMQESELVREAMHRQYGNLTGVAELREGLRSFCVCDQGPTHCLLVQLRSCCWVHKLSACLSVCCADQDLVGPKIYPFVPVTCSLKQHRFPSF